MGLYATDSKTGEIWWWTGEDTAPTKEPYLRSGDTYKNPTQTWEKACIAACKKVSNKVSMWWCENPTLYRTEQTETITVLDPLPQPTSKKIPIIPAFMRGNHTFVIFNSILDVVTHGYNADNLSTIEMAFDNAGEGNKRLHRFENIHISQGEDPKNFYLRCCDQFLKWDATL
jgi:hypothetical protein